MSFWSSSEGELSSATLAFFFLARFGLSSAWRTYPYWPFSPGVGFFWSTMRAIIVSSRPEFFLYLSLHDCHVCRVTHVYSGSPVC